MCERGPLTSPRHDRSSVGAQRGESALAGSPPRQVGAGRPAAPALANEVAGELAGAAALH